MQNPEDRYFSRGASLGTRARAGPDRLGDAQPQHASQHDADSQVRRQTRKGLPPERQQRPQRTPGRTARRRDRPVGRWPTAPPGGRPRCRPRSRPRSPPAESRSSAALWRSISVPPNRRWNQARPTTRQIPAPTRTPSAMAVRSAPRYRRRKTPRPRATGVARMPTIGQSRGTRTTVPPRVVAVRPATLSRIARLGAVTK